MESALLTKYAVASFTQALLAILITAFLLVSTKKDCSTWRLIMFFSALSLSMVSSFALVGMHAPFRAFFGPAQGFISLVGLVAMIQFAYTFPGGEVSAGSRRALVLTGGLVVMAFLTGATLAESRPEIAIVTLGAVTVILCLWAWSVFLTRSRAFTREAVGHPITMVAALRAPVGRAARAHRAFARLMILLVVLSLASLAEGLGLLSLQSLISLLTSVYILFLIAFVFVYVNNSPTESRS